MQVTLFILKGKCVRTHTSLCEPKETEVMVVMSDVTGALEVVLSCLLMLEST